MNFILKITTFLVLFNHVYPQSTYKNRHIYSRTKRYLTFPMGANFVYQIVMVKVLLQKVPKGVQWLTEFDVPYPLPTNATLFRGFKKGHKIQRRQLFNDIAVSLDGYGMNGTSCVQRIICEAKQFVPFKGKSLVKDLLVEIFLDDDDWEIKENLYKESCGENLLEECPHPLLDLMWRSFTSN